MAEQAGSPEALRQLRIVTWLLVVPGYLLSCVLPVGFAGAAVLDAVVQAFKSPRASVSSAAVHEGALWFATRAPLARDDEPCPDEDLQPSRLLRAATGSDSEPEEVVRVCLPTLASFSSRSRLLVDGDALVWVLPERVLRIESGAIASEVDAELPHSTTPLMHQGRLTAARVHESHTELYELRDEEWVALGDAPVGHGEIAHDGEVVSDGDRLHVFAAEDGAIVRRGEDGSSTRLDERLDGWSATVAAGGPLLFGLRVPSYGNDPVQLVAFGEEGGRWVERASTPADTAYEVAALPGRTEVVTDADGLGMGLHHYALDGDGLSRTVHEKGGQMNRTIALIVSAELAPFALTFSIALILSWRMARLRITSYREGVEYASIARRALAKVVDGLLSASVPLAYALLGGDPDGLLLVALGWGSLLFVALAVTEGLFGKTPGKWLLGIRVVDESLRPCGVGKALLRGFGAMIDGFFNGFVALIAVVYSDKWQRIGDRLAQTIVVRG